MISPKQNLKPKTKKYFFFSAKQKTRQVFCGFEQLSITID